MMDRLLRQEKRAPEPATPDSQLHALLARVRRRWRLRVALRGLALALAGVLAVLVLASVALEQSRWADDAVVAARVVAWAAVVALLAWWVARPLLTRVPAQKVALYLEEHDPSLDAALVSAVEQVEDARVGDARVGAGPSPTIPHSPVMRERLIASAVERARQVEARDPERPRLVKSGGMVLGLAAVAALLLAFGPQALRQGARVLLVPWGTAEASEALAVMVEPGNARLARGGDQEIGARLRGFAADDAELAVRRGDAGTWERIPMSAGKDSGTFVARLFDLDERTQYFVESNGVRSPVFTLDVANLPTVRRLDLEYRYPAYTGLALQRVEDGGDVAAPKGTVVRVRVTTTLRVEKAQLVVDGQPPVAMTRDSSGAMVAELRVQAAGFYHVELQAADGSMVRGSLDYAIDVLDDNAPTVTFKSPGRDIKVTSIEEIFAEVVAEDDYGVQSLELVYAANGGAEQAIALHKGGARREITGGHTFYLEELSLSPGDVISYYARAKDGTAHVSATDIYFMEVRPFEKEYRQKESGGQPQPGEEEPESPSALSRRQREIIAATFKVVRDSARLTASERRDNVSTIALSQGQLRERLESLVRKLSMRGVAGADAALAIVAEELPKAAVAMQAAEERLGRSRPGEALPSERTALQHLQRAEAAYREVQVAMGPQQQGGGGQGQQEAEDLADLFELDVDKMRNQYESVQRGGRSEANDRKVDETLEKLRALAQRQQQENERARRRAEAMQQGGGGGGQSQRQLAEETAEAARQLERLARERQSQELAESARRLQDAANAMKRSAAAGKEAGTAEGAAALDRLQDARRLIDKERTGRLENDARDAQRAADELAARQREIAKDVDRLQAGGGRDQALASQLDQRKEQLAKDVAGLEGQLDRLSRDARRDERDAARKLQDAAGGIRERRVADKVRYSRNTMRQATPEYAKAFEEQIASDLGRTREQVAEAIGAMGQASAGEKGQEALDKARELARGLESLRERARQGQQQGEQPGQQPGQQGQGQQGREGQQQGQQGQQQGGQQGGAPRRAAPQGATGQPGRTGGAGQGASMGGATEPVTPEQMRQWMREYRERRTEAEGLRRELQGTDVDVSQLEQTIRGLRALEGSAPYKDPAALQRLQEQVTEGFKAFEFTLRRQLAGSEDARPALGGAQEVSPKYRAMVEEYYRSLGRGKQ